MENLEIFYSKMEKGSKMTFCKDVARDLGMSAESVLKWCTGWRVPKDERVLKVLSEHSGIPVEQLFAF